jgi:predicted transcriptional regulator of viral defense system
MVMKSTILSQKDLEILEEIIISAGMVADSANIMSIIRKKYSISGAKNKMGNLISSGWLVKLKRGKYQVVADISGLSVGDLSLLEQAANLNSESYVSFESALQHHAMFDQMLAGVYSVTYKRARNYEVNNKHIWFSKIKKELYFGFEKLEKNRYSVKVAHAEKAILDIMHFKNNSYYVSLIWEIMKEHKKNIDFIRFTDYAGRFGIDIIRQAGFVMEKIGLNADKLLEKSKTHKGSSRMTKDSKDFNARWRLYYDAKVVD